MLWGNIVNVTDREAYSTGDPDWLRRQVIRKLTVEIANALSEHYQGEVVGTRKLADHATEYRLQLQVFTQDELDAYVRDQIKKYKEKVNVQ